MIGRRLPLLAPRSLPWPLKPLESATTSLGYDEHGRMVMRIRHDPLKGISPEMVAWWFRNIGGDMEARREAPQQVPGLASEGSHPLGAGAGGAHTGARAWERSSASWRRSGATRTSTSTSSTP